MSRLNALYSIGFVTFLVFSLCGCGGGAAAIGGGGSSNFQLSVQVSGDGSVSSSPAGINCGQTCSASFPSGTSVTLAATPASGRTFTGWSGACTGTGTCTVNLTAASSVTATFTAAANNVQLTVQNSGTGAGTVTSSPAGINCGQTCTATFTSGTSVTLTATPAADSTFTGWSGGCTGIGTCTANLAAATSVTATFTAAANNVQLTVQNSGSGTGNVTSSPAGIDCGQTCTATFASGTSVTLTATPASGSTFTGWSGACTGTSTCTVNLAAANSVTATFTAAANNVQLTVQDSGSGTGTVTSSPAGINCGSTCSANFPSGTSVTLTATPASGSTFAGWSGGGCTGTGTCTVKLTASTSVAATFTPSIQLAVQNSGSGTGNVTSSPAGIDCGPTCTARFPSGTSVTLTATPASGSTFTGWSGGCKGTGTCTVNLTAAASVTATFAISVQLTVQTSGSGTGTVTSSPGGIDCGQTCTASFPSGTSITLTTNSNPGSTFGSWSGDCSGSGACKLTLTADTTVTATFNPATGISAINHIIMFMQENRSFDSYFGALREYWAQNGYADESFDGLPQFNPTSGAAPLYAPPPTNPGCDPLSPPPADCVYDTNNPVTSIELKTVCTENTSPSWDEAHVDWDYGDQIGLYPAKNNGFVWTAAHDARTMDPPFNDTSGIRAMGYYDGTVLNYYYFMASNFATSDRWFNPAMTRTNPNREYLLAATSQGYAYPNGTNADDTARLTAKTIFQELQAAGVTWKIYVNPQGTSCSGPPYDAACLMKYSYLENFVWGDTAAQDYPRNFAPISEYFTDLQNGTLPQVAYIANAYSAGLDEHGSDSDEYPTNIQLGAKYTSSLINALMQSSSWADSVFIFTFDESGGLYDHVPPQPTVSPDGIKPVDLQPNDVCTKGTGPTCDFTYTGYRIPLIVISPFAKKHYVSHTVADSTAILKFIETRFGLPSLTKRDAAQMDMTEFFDFDNAPWRTPPTPPAQNTSGACYLDHLP